MRKGTFSDRRGRPLWRSVPFPAETAMTINRYDQASRYGAKLDARRRADYGGLALVFAEAAGRLPAWKEAVKEWNRVESQQVLEGALPFFRRMKQKAP